MSGIVLTANGQPPAPPVGSNPSVSSFLPKEHGSWSLALEPLALGLLVAPSAAGGALVAAALAAFFSRRPLKIALAADCPVRRQAARETVVMLSALAVAGLGEALVLGGGRALWPLLLAAPLGGLFAYFDAQNDSRAAAAELAGSATFALLPAALATLAGWPPPAALALSAVALARSVPTVLTVRTYLRLEKRQPARAIVPLAGGIVALASVGYLAAQQLVPWLAAALAALLLLRTARLVLPARPAWSAKRIGQTEAVLGALYVGALACAYHLP